MKPRLRITFVLPSQAFTGGVRVVYEHARQLLRRGHEVRIVATASRPGPPWSAEGRRQLRRWAVELWLERPAQTLAYYGLTGVARRVPSLSGDYLPDGDVLMATAWQTAEAVTSAPERCGRAVYFIQHWEAFTPEIEEAVAATWRLPIERIVIATWLRNLAEERFGVPVHGPVVNGVDLDQFHPRGRWKNDPPVVGMQYELQPWKGVEDGFRAVRLARASVPGLRLHLFGKYRLRHSLSPGDRYEHNPDLLRIPQIYRECDLFLSPSWTEGCQLPPMEAMASGCAVVATEVGGIPDYAVPDRTVLSAAPRDVRRLAGHLAELAKDSGLRRRIAEGGAAHIRQFTWDAATTKLENILFDIART